MELDKRIKEDEKLLSCFDTTFAEENGYKNKFGYFTDVISNYADLSNCYYGTLTGINRIGYQLNNDRWYTFFLPECKLKPKEEKKYRPYTIDEFCDEGFEILVFREKANPLMEYHVRYNGYRKYDNVYKVILGNIAYTFNDLFTDYEYLDKDDNWIPFGVEE